MGKGSDLTVKPILSWSDEKDKRGFWEKLADKVKDFFSDSELDDVDKKVEKSLKEKERMKYYEKHPIQTNPFNVDRTLMDNLLDNEVKTIKEENRRADTRNSLQKEASREILAALGEQGNNVDGIQARRLSGDFFAKAEEMERGEQENRGRGMGV